MNSKKGTPLMQHDQDEGNPFKHEQSMDNTNSSHKPGEYEINLMDDEEEESFRLSESPDQSKKNDL